MPDAASVTVAGPARRLLAWARNEATRLTEIAAGVLNALRRPATRPPDPAGGDDLRTPGDARAEEPRWGVVVCGGVLAGAVLAVRLSPATALFWYAFPLFAIGVAYVVQFRAEMTARWWAVLGASAVISAVALAKDWAFSGHVLFNVLLLGHAAQSPTRRTWIRLLLGSLVQLLVLKVAFQRPKDAVGGVISLVVAVVALAFAGPGRGRRHGVRSELT